MTLIEQFIDAFFSDTESYENKDTTLNYIYKHSTPEERTKIDHVFIALCGWSYKTLQEKKSNVDM